ncbi:zymogen granule membrane protein 16-like [Salarias fasciatus]|uniref:Zymogen granule membrane protein 16-like n=1 Tax=Salarias fasciatus TaxID=181472 RepID=A0A672I1A7_SALFA|nr:zymogen granule membrane protein 16-like [Salarias fasciatus]
MHCFAVLTLLAASAVAEYVGESPSYSFDPPVGSGSGTPYSISGEGRITAVRVWDNYNYVYGLQFRYGTVWSPRAGIQVGIIKEFELLEGEVIVQVSGKYSHYVNWLVFVTSLGRSMFNGQPSGHSFNMYAPKGSELVILSGRYHGALTSVGAHWAVIPQPDSNSSNSKHL